MPKFKLGAVVRCINDGNYASLRTGAIGIVTSSDDGVSDECIGVLFFDHDTSYTTDQTPWLASRFELISTE